MTSTNDTTLAGKLLLAMPNMTDPRFYRSVIFMCAHDEKGAMGLVINNQHTDIDFHNIMEQLGISSDITLDDISKNVPIMNGGPVDPSRGFLLHSSDFEQEDTIQIDERLSVTGTVDALRELAKGKGPEARLFMLGHAGWSPGQLESELARNAWLIAHPDPRIIFSPVHDEKWPKAMKSIGVDPAMLSSAVGRA